MNPILETYNTPHGAVPFQRIKTDHFLPALEHVFIEAYKQIEIICENKTDPDFYNIIEALEYSDEKVADISRIFFNLNHAETDDELQKLALDISPRLTEFRNNILLNPKLFERIQLVFEGTDRAKLTPEQNQLLDTTYKNFIRGGANLTGKEKEQFRRITGELSELTVRFGENVLAETNHFFLHITDRTDLSGLPENLLAAASEEASRRNLKGWVFTLHNPSFVPFMKYADNRGLRRKMFLAYNLRGSINNKNDNREILKRIVNLRLQLANLLGFSTYASYILDNRMAETVENVTAFLHQLNSYYFPKAKEEFRRVVEFAHQPDAGFEMQRWDWNYYSEKLKEAKYSITDEVFRPYFQLENVRKGIFDLANKLYSIVFRKSDEIPVYHKEMEVYEVLDEQGEFLAILYLDYFPRKSKKGGAWMTEFVQQHVRNGSDIRPHVSLVFNFTPPTARVPSLLTYSEVRTFLHEFGHALHCIFSKVRYSSLAGTEVYRDFVELPSQIMENWADQKEWINSAAQHYITGEKIPMQLLDKLIENRNFIAGFSGSRQLAFGYLDMAWHTITEIWENEPEQMERHAMSNLEIMPSMPGTSMSTSFTHIFAGGYAAGYYGYKWSEVLDADAFSVFKEHGIFDKKTADRFRNCILSKGGTEHPMKLFTDFMGRKPSAEALLKRSGLK